MKELVTKKQKTAKTKGNDGGRDGKWNSAEITKRIEHVHMENEYRIGSTNNTLTAATVAKPDTRGTSYRVANEKKKKKEKTKRMCERARARASNWWL